LNTDYIIARYVFNNTTNDTIANFHAGLYMDFDMDGSDYDDDRVAFNGTHNIGYVYDDNSTPITTNIGLSLLSDQDLGFFAMDPHGLSNPTISWDGFTDQEKWTALTGGTTYQSSGPDDISLVISAGPIDLLPNIKEEVDFVIAGGDNITNLTSAITTARDKYSDLPTNVNKDNYFSSKFTLNQNYPNPFNPSTRIQYSIPISLDIQNVSLSVFDILGREVTVLVNEYQSPGNYSVEWNAAEYPSGVYIYRLKAGPYRSTKRMLLLK